MAKNVPPLHAAAQAGKTKDLAQLLDAGADVNDSEEAGASALHYAAGKGQLAAVELLLERGAKVDVKSSSGGTALHYAASSKSAKARAVVERLIAAGADVNAVGKHGNTPLFNARTADIAQVLADAGAKLRHKNTDGHTAAQFAAIVGQPAREKFFKTLKARKTSKPKAQKKTKTKSKR